ncbi:MAG TPA: hypothetical protein VFP87_07130 [Chitinophagaceae bacterium]|nr:hypothetical protein [Chitinophagaceae bacterium]
MFTEHLRQSTWTTGQKEGDLTVQFETGFDYDYSVSLYHKETRSGTFPTYQML